MMWQHIAIGEQFPQIVANTLHSHGLDDQDFVLAFEANDPADVAELFERMRASDAAAYTSREHPVFTGVAMSIARALDALDGRASAHAAGSRTP